MAGYSGTSLVKKLGIKEHFSMRIVNGPAYYFSLFTDMPPDISIVNSGKAKKDFIHYFETDAKELAKNIVALKEELKPNGMIWVSWYKKSANISTDVSFDVIREIALRNGLVDIKICAVDNLWSGLKLVIPVKDRIKKLK